MNALWRKNKDRKLRCGNQTPGKAKGLTCQASSQDRYMAKHNRSYKHPDYDTWCVKISAIGGYK